MISNISCVILLPAIFPLLSRLSYLLLLRPTSLRPIAYYYYYYYYYRGTTTRQ